MVNIEFFFFLIIYELWFFCFLELVKDVENLIFELMIFMLIIDIIVGVWYLSKIVNDVFKRGLVFGVIIFWI